CTFHSDEGGDHGPALDDRPRSGAAPSVAGRRRFSDRGRTSVDRLRAGRRIDRRGRVRGGTVQKRPDGHPCRPLDRALLRVDERPGPAPATVEELVDVRLRVRLPAGRRARRRSPAAPDRGRAASSGLNLSAVYFSAFFAGSPAAAIPLVVNVPKKALRSL